MDRNLIEYLPEWLREFREIKALTSIQQTIAEQLWRDVELVYDNQFIETATEEGCSRYESMLGLDNTDMTLEERRYQISSFLIEQRPFTLDALKRILATLCGTDSLYVELSGQTLNIKITARQRAKYVAINGLLKRMVPANIFVNLSIVTNSWSSLSARTWSSLSQYKWEQLENFVITDLEV